MPKPFAQSSDQDHKKWGYLIISAVWLSLVLFVLVSLLFNDRSATAPIPHSPLNLLLVLAAAVGLWALRWSSLASYLEDHEPPASVISPSKTGADSIAEPVIDAPQSPRIIHSLFGTDRRFKLTWLLQSIAALALALMIVTQWRPLILALFFVSLVVGIEILWLLCRLDQALLGASQTSFRNDDARATIDNQQESAAAQQLEGSDDTVEQQEKLAVSYATTKEYEDLQSLRETLERERLLQIEEESSDAHEAEDESESQVAKPSRWQRDFRDHEGTGRVEGGAICDFSKCADSQIISVGFVPPFASRPDLLTECDAEDFFGVNILQSSPIGAKIEIRPLASNQKEQPLLVELFWEATSLS